jgi:hypothetical protein
VVEFDFPLLELALSGVESKFVEGFHGIWDVGVNVDGSVDETIGSYFQNTRQLFAACKGVV